MQTIQLDPNRSSKPVTNAFIDSKCAVGLVKQLLNTFGKVTSSLVLYMMLIT